MPFVFNPFTSNFDAVGNNETLIFPWKTNKDYGPNILLYGSDIARDIYFTTTTFKSSATFEEDLILGRISSLSPESIGTGVLVGGLISIDAVDPKRIIIEAGIGLILNEYDQIERISIQLQWPEFVGVVLPPPIQNQVSIYIDANGLPLIVSGPPDPTTIKDDIFLGRVFVSPTGDIIETSPQRWWGRDTNTFVRDFMIYVGTINSTPNGNVYGPSANDLRISKTAGSLFGVGFNFDDKKNPNNRPTPAQDPVPFYYCSRNGIDPFQVDQLDPSRWDNNGVVDTVPIDQFTIQRIYLSPRNVTFIQIGQEVYPTMETAIQGLTTEAFVPFPLFNESSVAFRGVVICQEGHGDDSDIGSFRFIPQDKFGQGGSTATSGGNVFGPNNSLDNSVAKFDGTSGKILTGSDVFITDSDIATLTEARVGVGTIPNASALLDLSSTTLGFLPPRLTNTERDLVVPPIASGLQIYNTDILSPEYFNGSNWLNQNEFSVFRQAGITGGGTIYSSGTTLSWSQRFIIISNQKNTNFPSGFFDVNMPPDGTVINGYGGAANITVAGGRIVLPAWGALWYSLPYGSGNATQNNRFYTTVYSSAGPYTPPANWLLIANHNSDNGKIRWANGVLTPQSNVGQTGTYNRNTQVKYINLGSGTSFNGTISIVGSINNTWPAGSVSAITIDIGHSGNDSGTIRIQGIGQNGGLNPMDAVRLINVGNTLSIGIRIVGSGGGWGAQTLYVSYSPKNSVDNFVLDVKDSPNDSWTAVSQGANFSIVRHGTVTNF